MLVSIVSVRPTQIKSRFDEFKHEVDYKDAFGTLRNASTWGNWLTPFINSTLEVEIKPTEYGDQIQKPKKTLSAPLPHPSEARLPSRTSPEGVEQVSFHNRDHSIVVQHSQHMAQLHMQRYVSLDTPKSHVEDLEFESLLTKYYKAEADGDTALMQKIKEQIKEVQK